MEEILNSTFVTELKLKLLELNNTAGMHAKYHLTDK